MNTTSPLLLLLVLIVFISGDCVGVKNSEIHNIYGERKHRVDAEQDPFTSVSLAAQSGDPSSTLFGSCLDKSRTLDAKFASIETLGGITYTRYVPDSNMLDFPMTWVKAVGSASNIFDCVSAAEDGGYSMFKYSINDCKLSKRAYDLNTVPQCEDEVEDAVFIKPALPGTCVFPSVVVRAGNICLILTEKLMTYDAAESYCNYFGQMRLYVQYYRRNILSLENVIAKIKEMGYTKNVWVGASYSTVLGWSGDFSPQDWINGTAPTDGSEAGYMDSQAGWKLRGGMKSALAGAVCIFADAK